MCGIFGWVGSPPVEPEMINRRLSRLLRHRGPDDAGFTYGPQWGAGFRRLSILDLSPLGHQPMASEDGRYRLIFNGEIYNYVELRQRLEQRGERFRSGSDTEVLLRMLQREGVDALPKLNGMFAFAFFDTESRTFLLGRDRLGQKPLYYLHHQNQLRFCSELKGLLAWPDAPKTINRAAVGEYLALTYLSGGTSIFEGYQKLPPAHFLTGHFDQPAEARMGCYWELEINDGLGEGGLSERELDELTDLLSDAIRIRLRSDVPLGIFLSGGLDSGLVAAMAGRLNGENKPIALTVGFDTADYDESPLAKAVAAQAELEHQIIWQKPFGLNDIDHLAWVYDEPFGDDSALPTMALCAAAAKVGTVFLSGDGGDEAFGGYERYIATRRFQWLAQLPNWVHRSVRSAARLLPIYSPLRFKLSKSALPDAGFAAAFDETPADPVFAHIMGEGARNLMYQASDPLWRQWDESRTHQTLLSRQQALDYRLYLPDDILVKMDRASMASSIEVRSPFLDYRLVEWAAKLPRGALIENERGKIPLRKLGQRYLPPSATAARKQGFGVPLETWFSQKEGQAILRERLLSSEAEHRGFWHLKTVSHMIDQQAVYPNGRNLGTWLWRLLMLDAWARQYLDTDDFLDGIHLEKSVLGS